MNSVAVEVNYFASIRFILQAKFDKDVTGVVPRIYTKIYMKFASVWPVTVKIMVFFN